MMKKYNFIRNRGRVSGETVDSTPQHVKLGITPIDASIRSGVLQANSPATQIPPSARQGLQDSPINDTQVLNSIPNLQQPTVSTLDGDTVIDQFDGEVVIDESQEPFLEPDDSFQIGDTLTSSDSELYSIVSELEAESYLLLVEGSPVCAGPLSEIEDQVSALIFGDHAICDGEPVDADHIIVLRKMNLRVGALLD